MTNIKFQDPVSVFALLTLFMHYDEKWSSTLQKSCGVCTERFYVWPFVNTMNEKVKKYQQCLHARKKKYKERNTSHK